MSLHFPERGTNCYAKTCYCSESELTFSDFSCPSNWIAVAQRFAVVINLKIVGRILCTMHFYFFSSRRPMISIKIYIFRRALEV